MDELRRLDDWSDSSEEPLGQLNPQPPSRRKRRSVLASPTSSRGEGAASFVVAPRPSATEVVGTVGALLLLAFFTFASFEAIILFSLQSDQCSGHVCNWAMFDFSTYAVPVSGILFLLLSILLAVHFARRDRPIWVPAVLSCAAIVVVFVIAALFNSWSVQDWGPVR